MCILTFQSLLWNLYLTSASCSIWESCHCLVELEQGPVKKLAVKVEVLFDKVLVSPFSFFISFACSSSKFCDGVHIIKCHHLLFSHESACSVCMSFPCLFIWTLVMSLACSFLRTRQSVLYHLYFSLYKSGLTITDVVPVNKARVVSFCFFIYLLQKPLLDFSIHTLVVLFSFCSVSTFVKQALSVHKCEISRCA